MFRKIGLMLVLLVALGLSGCGDPLAELNRLAALGEVHEDAPSTARLQIEIAAPVGRRFGVCWSMPMRGRSGRNRLPA